MLNKLQCQGLQVFLCEVFFIAFSAMTYCSKKMLNILLTVFLHSVFTWMRSALFSMSSFSSFPLSACLCFCLKYSNFLWSVSNGLITGSDWRRSFPLDFHQLNRDDRLSITDAVVRCRRSPRTCLCTFMGGTSP